MKAKHWLIGLGILFFVFCALIFRPVPIPSDEKECLVAEGTVSYIFEGGVKDVAFRLREYDKMFYINRGLEQGLELEALRNQLMGRRVTIKYPKYWTPLDPHNKTRHLSQLEYQGNVIFTEIN